MQQRRLRLGDILDDYCPRERRLTNHVVVAMIDDEVRQTRCSTCGADHDYKQARVPPRKKKDEGVLVADQGLSLSRPRGTAPEPETSTPAVSMDESPSADTLETADTADSAGSADAVEPETVETATTSPVEDEGPVHRRLIRATLPRPDGQAADWRAPEFPTRQPGGHRGDAHGNRRGSGRGHGRGQTPSFGASQRFGGGRHGNQRAQGQGQGSGQSGNRAGGRPGQVRGQRQGGGSGRKRGR